MHAKTHNQEKKYCCQVCDATFGTRKLFNKHKEGHNQCPHCDLVCQSRTVLTRHLRLHIGGQMDICKGNDDCIKCKKLLSLEVMKSLIEKEINSYIYI